MNKWPKDSHWDPEDSRGPEDYLKLEQPHGRFLYEEFIFGDIDKAGKHGKKAVSSVVIGLVILVLIIIVPEVFYLYFNGIIQ